MGDTLQRDMTDWAFRMLTPEVFNPWSDVNSELWQESAEIWRNLDPMQGAWFTWRELQNKTQVFNLVRNIPTTLQLSEMPPYPSLLEAVRRALLDQYSTLWAVEGIGHWYGDTFLPEVPRGILRDAYIRDVPEETMLNAGIGMSFAQHWINHRCSGRYSPRGGTDYGAVSRQCHPWL